MHVGRLLLIAILSLGGSSSGLTGSPRATPLESPKAQVSVGKNIHVSRETPTYMHAQTLVATNPDNPREMLACSHTLSAGDGEQVSFAYLSTDAGITWKQVFGGHDQMDGTDPTVAFGPDGTMHFAYISHPPGKLESVIVSSRDKGRTWSAPVRFDMIDRHFLMTDVSSGRHRGRVYVAGDAAIPSKGRGFGLRFSQDGGRTFSEVSGIKAEDGWDLGVFSPGVILSDGTTLFVLTENPIDEKNPGFGRWPTELSSRVVAVRSRDGGVTLERAGVLAGHYARTGTLLASNDFLGLAVDAGTGPFRDRVYAAFSSYDPQTGRRDILTSYSEDQGATWSRPLAVNDDILPADLRTSPKHFMPAVAVNKAGVVGVIWYDRRDSGNRLDWTVRFAASLDGGETFFPSVAVSEIPFKTTGHSVNKWFPHASVTGGGTSRKYGPYTRPDLRDVPLFTSRVSLVSANFFGQHTAGITVDADGVFHSLWIGNRTGVGQLWTAPIAVSGAVARHGGGELGTLEDLSDSVALSYRRVEYEQHTQTLKLDAQVENISSADIEGPLFLRVITTAPRGPFGIYSLKILGEYQIINADNGERGAGAAWRFLLPATEHMLRPGMKSQVRQLQFSVSAEPSFERAHHPDLGYNGGFLSLAYFDAKVLAKRKRESARSE